MTLSIDSRGLELILLATLSCKCPVSPEIEGRLFDEYFRVIKEKIQQVNFGEFLSIADSNPERTPLHNLFEMCSYAQDDPFDFHVTVHDVLRYFSSGFHFTRAVAGVNHMIVKDIPSYLVCHMLLPVRVYKKDAGWNAGTKFNDRDIMLENIFCPPGLEPVAGALYAFHMGVVLGSITDPQAGMIERHLSLIPGFKLLADHVSKVDFKDYQHYGNYLEQVEERFRRYYTSTAPDPTG